MPFSDDELMMDGPEGSAEEPMDGADPAHDLERDDFSDVIHIEVDQLSKRIHLVEGLPASTWDGLEATWGGFYILQGEQSGLLGEGEPKMGVGDLIHYDVAGGPTPRNVIFFIS